ncbi:MAG: TPR end-of-group domain-containing protein [Desulfuromonadaceae bacterium]
METKQCRCTNFSQCSKADNKETIDVPFGRDLKCPECGLDLDEIKESTSPFPVRLLLMIGAPAIIIIILGIYFFWGGSKDTPVEHVVPIVQAPSGPKETGPIGKSVLTGIAIKGAQALEENKSANYSITASFEQGEPKEVEATWSVSPNTYASISDKGVLTAKSIPSDQDVTVTAEYTEGGVTKKGDLAVTLKKSTASSPGPDSPSAAELKKLSAELNFQQGMNFVQNEDYGNAIKEFSAAIEKFPDYATAYSNRAVAYMQQNKFNLAAEDLKKAAQLSPQDAHVYYNLTALHSLQKQLDLALKTLDQALDLGFSDYDSLRKDPDLKNLRRHKEYRQVLEKHKIFLK